MAAAARCVRRFCTSRAAADARGAPPPPPAMEAPPPLLVQVLGGNVVTTASVLACLHTTDVSVLRRLHPALAAAVSDVPWADTDTEVHDTIRWRAALPAATGLTLAADALLSRGRKLAALESVTVLSLVACECVTDDVVARLPPTLRKLDVSKCKQVTSHVSFAHLAVLETLDCSFTDVVAAGLARLPPSLLKLHMQSCAVPDTADFSHLRQLRVVTRMAVQYPFTTTTVASLPPSLEGLAINHNNIFTFHRAAGEWPRGWSLAHLTRLCLFHAVNNYINEDVIASLPPSLHVLKLGGGRDKLELSSCVSFAHLHCLDTLSLRYTPISAAALATLPPSLLSLDLHRCASLTPDTVFPHLPALQNLTVNHTGLGNASIASMPACLEELTMVCCRNVTERARLDHLTALRVLQCVGTDLSCATIAACRARGCFAPADGKIAYNYRHWSDTGMHAISLVSLPDGRLVGARDCRVMLWQAAAGRDAVAKLELPGHVYALAVLSDCHCVAVGTTRGVVVWDTREVPPNTGAPIDCDSSVQALAMARNGHILAGCEDGALRVVDVDAGAVVATVKAHDKAVRAVAALLDGRVASVSLSHAARVWDVGTGACVATLAGHTGDVTSLAVLADGRLASGSQDHTVRLWDVISSTCIRVLTKHHDWILALTALPDNRLASLSADFMIRVWDTRDDASGAGGELAQSPPVLLFGSDIKLHVLAALPGNRLATGGGSGVYLWQLPPPDVDT